MPMPWRSGAVPAWPRGSWDTEPLGDPSSALPVVEPEREWKMRGDSRLVNWSNLPEEKIHLVFPDAMRLGEMEVEFSSTKMQVWRFSDAVGNDAFAFGRHGGAVSHGSHVLNSTQISSLRVEGADVGVG